MGLGEDRLDSRLRIRRQSLGRPIRPSLRAGLGRCERILLAPQTYLPSSHRAYSSSGRQPALRGVVRSGADVGICSRRFRRRERSLLGLLDDIQNSASLLSPFKDGGKVALDGCSGTVAVRDSTKYVYFLSNLTFLKTIITISYLVA
jgi:hypothetical protein